MMFGMSDDGKSGSECEVVRQAGQGCEAMERVRDCDAIGRAGGRVFEAAGRASLGLARILNYS